MYVCDNPVAFVAIFDARCAHHRRRHLLRIPVCAVREERAIEEQAASGELDDTTADKMLAAVVARRQAYTTKKSAALARVTAATKALQDAEAVLANAQAALADAQEELALATQAASAAAASGAAAAGGGRRGGAGSGGAVARRRKSLAAGQVPGHTTQLITGEAAGTIMLPASVLPLSSCTCLPRNR